MKRPTLQRSASRTIDRVPSTFTLSKVSEPVSSMIPATCKTRSQPSAHPRSVSDSLRLAGQDSTPDGHCLASCAAFRLSKRTECPAARISVTAACPMTPVPPVTNTFIVISSLLTLQYGQIGCQPRDRLRFDLVLRLT